jgi:hypothetical protein
MRVIKPFCVRRTQHLESMNEVQIHTIFFVILLLRYRNGHKNNIQMDYIAVD